MRVILAATSTWPDSELTSKATESTPSKNTPPLPLSTSSDSVVMPVPSILPLPVSNVALLALTSISVTLPDPVCSRKPSPPNLRTSTSPPPVRACSEP